MCLLDCQASTKIFSIFLFSSILLLKVIFNAFMDKKEKRRVCTKKLKNRKMRKILILTLKCSFWVKVGFLGLAKAVTYDERPKMKRDARLNAVFFPRKRLLSVEHLSSFSGVRRTLRL